MAANNEECESEENNDARFDEASMRKKPFSIHNIFMDVVIRYNHYLLKLIISDFAALSLRYDTIFCDFFYSHRILKVLGCKFGCHENNRGSGFHSSAPPPPPSSGYCSLSNGITVETLRSRGVGLLSRLLWYDKRQFRQFFRILVETRDIQFLITFFHGYLAFCSDPTNPFSFTGSNQSSNCKFKKLINFHFSL
jgi:hypothetical protein